MDDLTVDTTIETGSLWKHRKGGCYEVLAVGRVEADLAPVVIYQSKADRLVWVRPLDEFEDGRFTQITNEE